MPKEAVTMEVYTNLGAAYLIKFQSCLGTQSLVLVFSIV